MVSQMYVAENFEFKFSRVKSHLEHKVVLLLLSRVKTSDSKVYALTEGKTRHWFQRYHIVVSTLALGLKINFDHPMKWMEFQKLVR